MIRAALPALLLALPALAQNPLAEDGQRLARQWCAGCHAIAPGMAPPTGDAAPPFAGMAPRLTADGLRGFLSTPHAGMPDLRLSRAEIEALSAYLLSLRPPG